MVQAALAPMKPTCTDLRLGRALITVPGVVASAVGGSRASGLSDASSDTDAYAFFTGPVPQPESRACALRALMDDGRLEQVSDFGPEDHALIDGHPLEVVYLSLESLTRQVDLAFSKGLMSEGFTTCFLWTVVSCVPLADDGSLARLRSRLSVYPEATRTRVLTEAPRLISSYLEQLAKAQHRGDVLMSTHRRASVQAAWFDMVFALNRSYHPGEKRLLDHLTRLGTVPAHAAERWADAQLLPADSQRLHHELESLTQDLTSLAR